MAEQEHAHIDRPLRQPLGSRFYLARWLLLRLLGLVFLIAIVSFWCQAVGLIGSNGILPAEQYLEAVKNYNGAPACYLLSPTLFWFGASNSSLHSVCAVGVLLSLLLIADVAPRLMLILLWIVYLSIVNVGQMFLSFQWDVLLLETAFFAIFTAPWRWRPRLYTDPPPATLALMLLWWLLFKFMFLAGITKLLSGDPTWRDLSALNFHYYTQPIPTWTSWYVHQLPTWFHKTSVLIMFVIELVVPFAIVAPRIARHVAAVLMIGLQLMLATTGNYGFFNLLTIAMCVPLFDDQLLRRLWLLRRWQPGEQDTTQPAMIPRWRKITAMSLAATLLFLSTLSFTAEIITTYSNRRPDQLGMIFKPLIWIQPLRTINGYGLFRVMTTSRPEFVLQGTIDGRTWRTYEFKYKPGELMRAPPFVAPHMPRLDWQMWFAALSPQRYSGLLQSLITRLFEAEPTVLALLEDDPFPHQRPNYMRLIHYDYKFTDPQTRRDTGQWWERRRLSTSNVIYPPNR